MKQLDQMRRPFSATFCGSFGVILLVMVGAVALLVPIAAAYAQMGAWEAAMQSAEDAISGNEVEKVEAFLKQAIQLAEEAPSAEEDLALSLTVLASVYHGTGRYNAAEPLLLRALPLTEKVRGADHVDVARILGNLGLLYHSRGDYVQAEEHYQRSLKILKAAFGPNHPELILTLNNLGALDMAEDRYPEAEEHYKMALAIAENAADPPGPYLTVALRGYANLLKLQGRSDEARDFEDRAKQLESGGGTSMTGLLVVAVPFVIVATVIGVLVGGLLRGKANMVQKDAGEEKHEAQAPLTEEPEDSDP